MIQVPATSIIRVVQSRLTSGSVAVLATRSTRSKVPTAPRDDFLSVLRYCTVMYWHLKLCLRVFISKRRSTLSELRSQTKSWAVQRCRCLSEYQCQLGRKAKFPANPKQRAHELEARLRGLVVPLAVTHASADLSNGPGAPKGCTASPSASAATDSSESCCSAISKGSQPKVTASAVAVLVLLLVALCVPQTRGALPASQVAALVDLYTSTSGSAWTTSTNWLSGDPCTNAWWGVGCTGTTSHDVV